MGVLRRGWAAFVLACAGSCRADAVPAGGDSTTAANATATHGTSTTSANSTTGLADSAGTQSTGESTHGTSSVAPTSDTSATDGETASDSTTSGGPRCMLPDTTGEPEPPLDLGVDGGCGNGIQEPGEWCDDGNQYGGDGCEPDCTSSVDLPPLWTTTIGGPNTIPDCGNGVAFDSQGNLIIAGHILDQIWIRKLDTDYQELWTYTYPNEPGGNCNPTPIAVDSEDNIAFAGVTGQSADVDWRFGLLDPDGEEIWTHLHDGPVGNTDRPYGIAIDSQDNIVIAGVDEFMPGMGEGVIRKYDNDGNLLWHDETTGGDAGQGWWWSIAVDACDDILVSGTYLDDETAADIVVRKYLANGEAVWEHAYSAPNYDIAYGIAVDARGDAYLAGGANPGTGYPDIWLARIARDGTPIWDFLVDGDAHDADAGRAIVVAADGSYWAAGITTTLAEGRTTWLQHADHQGTVYWTRTLDFDAAPGWLAVARAQDGRIASAGAYPAPFPYDSEAVFAVFPP